MPKKTIGEVMNELIRRSNSDMQRLRLLEQNTEVFRTQIDSLEQSILTQKKQLQKEFAQVNSNIAKMDTRIARLESNLKELIKQLKGVATKADVAGLEELVEIYNPIKSSFATREEVEQMLEDRKK